MTNTELRSMWEQYLAEYETSGQTVKAWCQEQAIKESRFYYWQRKMRMEQTQKEQPVKWLSLDLDHHKQASLSFDCITVNIGQATIELRTGFDQDLFREIVQALQTL